MEKLIKLAKQRRYTCAYYNFPLVDRLKFTMGIGF